MWRRALLPSWSGDCSGSTCAGLLPQQTASESGQPPRGPRWQPVRQAEGGEKPLQAYTVEQVAKMLHVGRDKVYYLLRTGQLRSLKIGKLRRITEQQLAEFIASLDDSPCHLGTSWDFLKYPGEGAKPCGRSIANGCTDTQAEASPRAR